VVTFSVSIHAPTRGATKVLKRAFQARSFNPRAHAGRDACLYLLVAMLLCFNPRAHAGRDN